MADIGHLPFRDGVFGAVVSAYTIQHIAESRQSRAVAELYRVLEPGGHLCIVSAVRRPWAHRALVLLLRAIRTVLNLLSTGRPAVVSRSRGASASSLPPHELYFHGRDRGWWRRVARGLTRAYSVEGLRLFRKSEFELLFGDSMRAATCVRALEALFPRITAGMCTILLVDMQKGPSKGSDVKP